MDNMYSVKYLRRQFLGKIKTGQIDDQVNHTQLRKGDTQSG